MKLMIEEIDHSIKKNIYPQSICLNMIVKNEAHVLQITLDHLLSKIPISYWVISDTGSTDGTQDIIRNFFRNRNIPGELVEHAWRDFGYNRTKALECAFNKTDYLFIFDADDTIGGDFVMPPRLTADRYDFIFGRGFTYHRPLLINNRLKWEFRGVLHEFLSNIDPIQSSGLFPGNYFIESGRSGARNKDPDKYLKDAIILKNAFEEEVKKPDGGLSGRYAFYCAQSYKDCNHIDDAIDWYLKCLDLNVWVQEKYHSCLMLGEMYDKKKDDYKVVKYFLKAAEYDTERIDGVVFAMKRFNRDGMFVLTNALYHKYKNYKRNLDGRLFLFDYLYQDEMEFENSVAAFYCKDFDSGYLCCKKLLSNQIANMHFLIISVLNLQFYKGYIEKDNEDTLSFFYGVDKVICELTNRNDTIQPHTLEIWNLLFEKNRNLLIDMVSSKKELVKLCLKFRDIYNENIDFVSNNNKNNIISKKNIDFLLEKPKVVVTFTTCKRYDLFQQTMASILNHWTNIEKVDYWFCVDDNSSEEERLLMRKNYAWIEYYMKGLEEKGHRKSMNIIWNKLHELNPTYWIHIEDDFLFHHKMDYVEEGIRGLEELKTENVKQIIFNLNYGETVNNYDCKSHINKNNGFSVQDYKNGNFHYQNCHYWPHFSFRPGITEVSTILKLGNYDSPNEFFEMDYALRWTNGGYKTGFFNKITCRHIGRLTSERSDPTKPNAYNLNNEGQYMMGGGSTTLEQKVKRSYIQIVNLEKRTDRRENTEKILKEQGFAENTDYQFIKAVDGYTLEPTLQLKKLFEGNDFLNRKGFIGAALSHLSLWKQLINDLDNEFYLIMEDDFTFIQGGDHMRVKEKVDSLKKEMKERDCLFLGYHMFDEYRGLNVELYGNNDTNIDELSSDFQITGLNRGQYIGGFYGYSLNKAGARKMVEYIEKNGIKHGIDWLFKIYRELDCYELQPQLVYSIWNEHGRQIDTNIQQNFEQMDFSLITDMKENFVFVKGLDQGGNDVFYHRGSIEECMDIAWKKEECICFNTLGFFKDKIEELHESPYFGENDGIWIKKKYYQEMMNEQTKMIESSYSYINQYDNENSKNKNFCFIHSCYKLDYGIDVLNHLVSTITKSGLLDHMEKVFIVNHGEVIPEDIQKMDQKIKVLHLSKRTSLFEVSTIQLLYHFCKRNEDCNVLYLHTKGISRNEIQKRIEDWTNLMLYFLVEKHTDCLEKLDSNEYDTVGCNYFEKDCYGNRNPHFSGNFWWVKSGYMNRLDITRVKTKHDAEFFVLSEPSVRLFNIYHSNVNHYEVEYPREIYAGFDVVEIDSSKTIETIETIEKKIRVKMLCNWCSSETLCKEWSNMCEDPEFFIWKNIKITWENENIDYYVIINRPQDGEYYVPEKTIVFQMEPWIHDGGKPWGVKTWGEWAIPDEKKFLAVRGRHNDCWNNAFWQLELTLGEIQNLNIEKIDKSNRLSTICSSKYFDEGHILRIDFLKYIEKRMKECEKPDFELDIYNYDNNHQFDNFQGRLDPYIDKSKGILPYKYYFMVENNFEENFITEKLWEPILCETLVFYYGCPNVSKYINPLAYVQLDMYNFEKSYELIERAIREDWWSQRIDIIRQEKEKILNQLAFFPTIRQILG